MKVTNENTLSIITNIRADGQQSRADYVELMQVEIDRLKMQNETTLDRLLLMIRAFSETIEAMRKDHYNKEEENA